MKVIYWKLAEYPWSSERVPLKNNPCLKATRKRGVESHLISLNLNSEIITQLNSWDYTKFSNNSFLYEFLKSKRKKNPPWFFSLNLLPLFSCCSLMVFMKILCKWRNSTQIKGNCCFYTWKTKITQQVHRYLLIIPWIKYSLSIDSLHDRNIIAHINASEYPDSSV